MTLAAVASAPARRLDLTLLHRIEETAARAALAVLRSMSPVAASNLGGLVARTIGPMLPVSRVADDNLRQAMPALDHVERRQIVRGVWDNLGRVVGELPHVSGLAENRAGPGWDMQGEEHLTRLARDGGPAIMFTGHIGNWEILTPAAAAKGVPFATLYRAANNPRIDDIILDLRRDGADAGAGTEAKLFAKGTKGARQTLAHLKSGGFLGLLPDQKMNDGIACRFFGHPAMTAPALAIFALRFQCPVMPIHVRRLGPARFRIVCEAPLPLPHSGDRTADVATLMQAVNDRMEAWIREAPESWLWLHRRWPRAGDRNAAAAMAERMKQEKVGGDVPSPPNPPSFF